MCFLGDIAVKKSDHVIVGHFAVVDTASHSYTSKRGKNTRVEAEINGCWLYFQLGPDMESQEDAMVSLIQGYEGIPIKGNIPVEKINY